jgi:hypothetical protein
LVSSDLSALIIEDIIAQSCDRLPCVYCKLCMRDAGLELIKKWENVEASFQTTGLCAPHRILTTWCTHRKQYNVPQTLKSLPFMPLHPNGHTKSVTNYGRIRTYAFVPVDSVD